ncbi:hypothetical protein ACTWQB_05755 [Piscibacillus sp. B03]|uniref:hypothetical protein n=1 Tax=Piscibacillus sp. B03 TaxID=3457430 RepID=UPI003FCED829
MKKIVFSLLLVLLIGCGTSGGSEPLSDKINEQIGVKPYLPETEYPINLAIIEYRTVLEDGEQVKGDPLKARVEYGVSQEEKVDQEFLESWKEQHPDLEIIHGNLYMDQTAIGLSISPGGVGEMTNAEVIEIEGHEVDYQFIEREETQPVIISINFEDVGYMIEYQAEEDDIEEEAKAFAADIINHYNSK